MTQNEVKIAVKILSNRMDRYETIGTDSGGWALTAYWLDGGQTMFRTLEHVREHVNSHTAYTE